jgi:hypothetical protein
MSFEFGVFHEFPRYAGVTDAEAFTQSFAQVDAAERWSRRHLDRGIALPPGAIGRVRSAANR